MKFGRKGKLFGLINIIDLGVILVILAVSRRNLVYEKDTLHRLLIQRLLYYIKS